VAGNDSSDEGNFPIHMDTYDFIAYGVGLISASVCTSMDIEDATRHLNLNYPTGIESDWSWAKGENFATGEPNPRPCDQNPETHKHYLFHC
jgi:hypothetical protein